MVEVTFTFTPQKLTDALRHYRLQQQPSRRLGSIFIVLVVLIVIVGWFGSAWAAGLLAILCFAVLFALPYLAEWFARRSFCKSPFCNEDVVQRFDETGLHETSGKSDNHLSWSAFTKVVHFDDGFLLFSGPTFFRWIPIDAFVNAKQISDFQELLRANLSDYEVNELKLPDGVTNTLKHLALGFYLGLTGDDFKPKESSTVYRWSIRGFWISFLVLMVVALFGNTNRYWMIAGMVAVCSLIICGCTYVCAVAAREIKKLKSDNWRFSLKSLLIAITFVALALGGIIYAARS